MYKAFMTGVVEFRLSVTTGYSDPRLDHAYDIGREFAHRITLRKFDF